MNSRWLPVSALAACLGAKATIAQPTPRPAAPAASRPAAPAGAPTAPLHVVLDAGHGGINTGARGAASAEEVLEKRVTLAVTQLVAAELRAAGVEVSLTREVDRPLTLRQRSALANRLGADVFVSLHANASPSRTQRGFETYVLTPSGVDVIAPALRGGEPSARAAGRGPGPALSAELASVIDDIERGAAQWEAADLAASVQRALRPVRGREHDRGVRQDAQHVLLGATMPAVLIEIGFIDHAVEGRELVEPEVQRELAKAIASAIREEQ